MATSLAELPVPEPDSADAGKPAPPWVESRSVLRQPLEHPVRLGWINDDKRMEYLAGQGIDISSSGLAVLASQRLRLSALVHVEIAGRELVAIGRVRNCIQSGNAWRAGIELVPLR